MMNTLRFAALSQPKPQFSALTKEQVKESIGNSVVWTYKRDGQACKELVTLQSYEGGEMAMVTLPNQEKAQAAINSLNFVS